MPSFENRKRMTLEEAKMRLVEALEPDRIQHIVANDDGSYSLVGHLIFGTCDYCIEVGNGVTEHVAKKDIYEEVSRESEGGSPSDG